MVGLEAAVRSAPGIRRRSGRADWVPMERLNGALAQVTGSPVLAINRRKLARPSRPVHGSIFSGVLEPPQIPGRFILVKGITRNAEKDARLNSPLTVNRDLNWYPARSSS